MEASFIEESHQFEFKHACNAFEFKHGFNECSAYYDVLPTLLLCSLVPCWPFPCKGIHMNGHIIPTLPHPGRSKIGPGIHVYQSN